MKCLPNNCLKNWKELIQMRIKIGLLRNWCLNIYIQLTINFELISKQSWPPSVTISDRHFWLKFGGRVLRKFIIFFNKKISCRFILAIFTGLLFIVQNNSFIYFSSKSKANSIKLSSKLTNAFINKSVTFLVIKICFKSYLSLKKGSQNWNQIYYNKFQ